MSKYLAKAITDLVVRKILTLAPHFTIGVWVAAEVTDVNLSQVRSGGIVHRFVPKLSSASALAAGDQVLLMKAPGVPQIIIGEVVGDITDT